MEMISKLVRKENQENLKKDLKRLRVFLNYKNSTFCKNKLDDIINYYFGEENE